MTGGKTGKLGSSTPKTVRRLHFRKIDPRTLAHQHRNFPSVPPKNLALSFSERAGDPRTPRFIAILHNSCGSYKVNT
jgi:hypothetical protein